MWESFTVVVRILLAVIFLAMVYAVAVDIFGLPRPEFMAPWER